ncbi:thioredoxin family protein [Taibaiella koreensis]|uniref:thioredoxin family protein n=1 Tax=Taibaiella koreensis TaxID=1268548 RepID=UPI000E59A719|nr:thioredoxin family protein [Taibaiella koreensis]
MYKYGMTLLLLLFAYGAGAQVFTDPAAAFAMASQHQKPVLLVFQGSDWCIPCIRLEQQVLSAPRFTDFARDRFFILKADFPQKKKIPPALQQQYDSLAEAFNAEGRFPKILLLGKDRQLLHAFQQDYPTPAILIAEIEKALKEIDAAM